MKSVTRRDFCFLAVFFLILQAVPYCFSESFVIEVPGYAKAVVGSYGSKVYCVIYLIFFCNVIIFFHSGDVGVSYWAPHRKFYSFRSLYYAEKITNETRFLVKNL